MHPVTLTLALLLLATPSTAAEPEIPAPAQPASAEEALVPGELLDPAPVPRQAQSPDEPPVLARPDARVFTYGEDVPRLRCVPYRVCTLLFDPQESILKIALGDSERWEVQLFDSGPAPAIVYKPSAFNLFSNLVVQTDRRLYSIELIAPSAPKGDPRNSTVAYDAVAKFRYPHDWIASAPPKPTPAPEPAPAPGGATARPADLHFDYAFDRPLLRSHRLPWTPDIVYDDGERTYIHLPPEAHRHDLPAVLLVDDSGEPTPTDTTLSGRASDWLVVPVVTNKLQLVTSTPKTSRRLTIVRRGA